MKKLLFVLLAIVVFNGITSAVLGGHLTDFASGFTVIEKKLGKIKKVDLTKYLVKDRYSYYNPQAQMFEPKDLIIHKNFDIQKNPIDGVVDELKRKGEQEYEIALPIFSGPPGFSKEQLLTNVILISFKPEFNPNQLLENLKQKHCVIVELTFSGYTITLTLKSDLNPLELCSLLTVNENENIIFCVVEKVIHAELYPVPESPIEPENSPPNNRQNQA